jgi:peptide/nickel transport system substrate-binding protein
VRRALEQAINADSLIDEAAGGHGVRTETGFPKGSWAYAPIDLPPFDPGAAAAALERAGWSRGLDGVRENSGLRLSFALSTTNDPQRIAIAQNVARQWRAVGVEARVQPLSTSTFIDEVLLPRAFEAALVAVDPGPDPDPYPFWHSSQIAPPGRNLANYKDTRIDEILSKARQDTEPRRRTQLYELFSAYLVVAMPSVPLFSPTSTYVRDTRVRGFQDSLLFKPASRFFEIQKWYVETRVK